MLASLHRLDDVGPGAFDLLRICSKQMVQFVLVVFWSGKPYFQICAKYETVDCIADLCTLPIVLRPSCTDYVESVFDRAEQGIGGSGMISLLHSDELIHELCSAHQIMDSVAVHRLQYDLQYNITDASPLAWLQADVAVHYS